MQKGKIEKIWENKTRDGTPYWVLAINGDRYSAFEQEMLHGLQEGDEIEFDWKQAGRYRNLAELRKLSASRADAPYDRDLSIVRMSCLRSAAELLAYQRLGLEKKGELVVDLAARFEAYVLGGSRFADDDATPDVASNAKRAPRAAKTASNTSARRVHSCASRATNAYKHAPANCLCG